RGRAGGVGRAEQVLADDDHHQATGADVRLRAGVDQAETLYIQRTGQYGGGHVRHQRLVTHLGNPVELQAADGFVRGVVHIGGIGRQLPLVLPGDGEVIVALGRGRDVDVTVTGGLRSEEHTS